MARALPSTAAPTIAPIPATNPVGGFGGSPGFTPGVYRPGTYDPNVTIRSQRNLRTTGPSPSLTTGPAPWGTQPAPNQGEVPGPTPAVPWPTTQPTMNSTGGLVAPAPAPMPSPINVSTREGTSPVTGPTPVPSPTLAPAVSPNYDLGTYVMGLRKANPGVAPYSEQQVAGETYEQRIARLQREMAYYGSTSFDLGTYIQGLRAMNPNISAFNETQTTGETAEARAARLQRELEYYAAQGISTARIY